MKIELKALGKQFNYQWVIRDFSLTLQSPIKYAVIGPNGAGKSTFLGLLSGQIMPTSGEISWIYSDKLFAVNQLHTIYSWCSPAIGLPLDLTLTQFLTLHFKFKPEHKGFSIHNAIEDAGLKKAIHKPLKYFSSGMLQRVKLIAAIGASTPMLLLDEPSSNLDIDGKQWLYAMLNQHTTDRLVIVASNEKEEIDWCEQEIKIISN